MNTKNRVQVSGIVGMVAAVLMTIALFAIDQYGLQPPGDGSFLYFAGNIVALIASAGYVIMLVGLWRSKAAGEGIFGKMSLGIFIAGMVLLVIGQAVELLSITSDLFVVAGGLLLLLGGLLTGIAVVTARRWDGWQRFAPLLQGLYFLILLVPTLISGQSFAQLGEFLWQVTWFITSLALYTKAKPVAQEGQQTVASNRGLA
jgi:hypothetical protein